MRSKRSHEGYLLIDHTNSPGLTEDILAPIGRSGPVVGEGQKFEAGVLTCAHCQRQVIINPLRTRDRNYCRKCDHYVCDEPGCAECNGSYRNLMENEYEAILQREAQDRQLLPNLKRFSAEALYNDSLDRLLAWDIPGALKNIERAEDLQHDPRYVWQRGMCRMLTSQWALGWPDFAIGLDIHPHGYKQMPHFLRWNGEPGKKVLVLAEQGIGDMIMMSRYLPWVAERSDETILMCHETLEPLFRWHEDFTIADPAEPFEYDAWVYASLLPLLHGTTPKTAPTPMPELRDAALLEKFALAEAPGQKIGICWAGASKTPHDQHRSMALDDLAPVIEGSKAEFYSFQIDAKPPLRIVDLSDHLTDWLKTAAALVRMDAVVTVDTAIAHLAGSLGVPTHLLLSRHPEWRWPLGATKSPWYPSMTVHWQETLGDWTAPVGSVMKCL